MLQNLPPLTGLPVSSIKTAKAMAPAAVLPSTMLSFTVSVNRKICLAVVGGETARVTVQRATVRIGEGEVGDRPRNAADGDDVAVAHRWLIAVAGSAPSAVSRLENAAGRATLVSSFCKPAVSSSVTVVPVISDGKRGHAAVLERLQPWAVAGERFFPQAIVTVLAEQIEESADRMPSG